MSAWQSKFGGVGWRVTPEGVEVERPELFAPPNQPVLRTKGEPITARRLWNAWGSDLRSIAIAAAVPPEILMMTVLTEGGLKWMGDHFTYPSVREEPGFKSDDLTPHRVSIGPMHILLSNYRALMYAPKATRKEASDRLSNLLAGALFIRQGLPRHGFDPILVAAIYNSGGIYTAASPNSKYHNPFHLKAWPGHLERAARWYGDALAVLAESPMPEIGANPLGAGTWRRRRSDGSAI